MKAEAHVWHLFHNKDSNVTHIIPEVKFSEQTVYIYVNIWRLIDYSSAGTRCCMKPGITSCCTGSFFLIRFLRCII